MTKEELLSRMSSKEFSEWQAFYQVSPVYKNRSLHLMGQLCSIVANAHSEEGKDFSIEDFIPEVKEQNETTQKDLKEKAINITRLMGGEVNV